MQRRTTVKALAASVTLLAAASACASGDGAGDGSSGSGGGGDFNILLITTTSGPLGVFGSAFSTGVETAADVINADAGVNGADVNVKVLDMGGDPTKGVTLLQRELSGSSAPDLVFTGITGVDCLAMSPIVAAKQLLSVCYGQNEDIGGSPKDYPYSFTVNSRGAVMGELAAEQMYEAGHTSAVVTYPDQDAGKQVAEAFEAKYAELGGNVIDSLAADPTAADLTPVFAKAYSEKPSAIFASGQGVALAQLNS